MKRKRERPDYDRIRRLEIQFGLARPEWTITEKDRAVVRALLAHRSGRVPTKEET